MSHKRVAIFISGSGSNMVSLIEDMKNRDHPARPVLVLSNTPDVAGVTKATELGVPTKIVDRGQFKGDKPGFEASIAEHLDTYKPDIICLAGFMSILSAEFTRTWAGKIINIHPSLLPAFKGLNTHRRAIESGATFHGCSVHEVVEGIDDGFILGQAVVPILENDTPDVLAQRVLEMEHKLYPMVLRSFADGTTTKPALFWNKL